MINVDGEVARDVGPATRSSSFAAQPPASLRPAPSGLGAVVRGVCARRRRTSRTRRADEHRHDFDDVRVGPARVSTRRTWRDKPTWMRDLPPLDRAEDAASAGGQARGAAGPRRPDRPAARGAAEDRTAQAGPGSSSSPTTATCSASTASSTRSSRTRSPAGIPFVVRGPGVAPGSAQTRSCRQVDLMPTTLDIAGSTGRRTGPDGALDAAAAAHRRRSRWRRRPLVENPDLGWAMLREGSTGLHRAPRARRVGALRPGVATPTSCTADEARTSPTCRGG